MSSSPPVPVYPGRSHRKASYPTALLGALFAFWLLWSGHFSPLLLTFGVLSCLFVVFLSHRMGIDDPEGVPLLGVRPLGYAAWLAVEIVKCNIDVSCRILNPGLPIQPTVIRVKSTQKSDLGRVVLANSITLTPGTVSMAIHGDEITVHALTQSAAEFDASGEMNRRVTAVEGC